MIVNVLSILSKQGNSIVSEIRKNLANTGTNATNETSRSLRFEVNTVGDSQTLRIIGRPYFMTVETGRKPTPQYTKPSYDFVNRIKKWASAEGLPEGTAYAIAKSIHQKGTKLFREGGRKDIVSNVINQSLVDEISQEVLNQFAQEYLRNAADIFVNGRNNN